MSSPVPAAAVGSPRPGSSPVPPPPAESVAAPAELTNWFLNAKRSLSSVALCSRAHVLVDSARAAIQDASVISARCVFLRNSLADQLAIARQINRMMHASQDSFRGEFEKTLNELDNADLRLNSTLELLRNSVVDAAFFETPPPPPSQPDDQLQQLQQYPSESGGTVRGLPINSGEDTLGAGQRVRTLHDFVEDQGIENLKSKLRHSIDDVQESHDAIQSSLESFDGDLAALATALTGLPDLEAPANASPPLHPYLQALEEHTEAMATLLASLTNHYDRCSTALKDAEGAHTLSAADKSDLYAVLANDASEVDDVCAEIRDRLADMEAFSSRIAARITALSTVHGDAQHAFGLFATFARNLAAYVDAARTFSARQADLRTGMATRLDELVALADFYDAFVAAYDAMIIEVARRKGLASRREALVADALRKLEKLAEEDLEKREAFRDEFGMWLPVDIWPGIADRPIKYRVERDLQGGRELPRLGKDVLEKAVRRRQEAAARGRAA